MLKKIVQFILATEAKLVIRRFKPKIVAVTGSVGKTSTKEAIFTVLSTHFRTRKSPKSYNSNWGVPLTILGLNSEWNSPWGWLVNMVKGMGAIFAREYPEILVLEMGVDRPGDIDYLLSMVKPNVSVVTAIGEIPVHVEFFSGPKAVAYEKGKIVRATLRDGTTILNFDDEVVSSMRAEAPGNTVTFGVGKGADMKVSQYKLLTETGPAGMVPKGVTFKLDYKGNTVPIRLEGAFGKQQMYVVSAAAAVGAAFDLNLIKIAEALATYKPAPGRLHVVEGIKDSLIVDDTYNASPMAMHAALDTLKDMPARRKIAVLGDMLEIGKYTIEAHQAMGELAAPILNLLITVGPRAKFIAKEAIARGMDKKNVLEFPSSKDAGRALQEMITPGDLILVKGSQSMRMEHVVEEVMRYPEKKEELLVRQDIHWKKI